MESSSILFTNHARFLNNSLHCHAMHGTLHLALFTHLASRSRRADAERTIAARVTMALWADVLAFGVPEHGGWKMRRDDRTNAATPEQGS
jgi:hypothetical protein